MRIQEENLLKGSESRKIYTVSQLNRQARMLLESRFPTVWVEGEISNFKRHTSGHIYLTLKDEASQIQAAFFNQYHRGLKFELKDGLKVLAFCRVSIYEARGQYQLYVERIEPQGVGALQLAFQQLKERLEKEGLFLQERKRPIPPFPKIVGVITSPTGAAIHDILNVVNRRFCGTHIQLYPAKVQGEGAADEIAAALRVMNERSEAEVLIVGRGGGSLEDLWAFNEEAVARAVFASRIPVISAVGHETDWTICDLVADLRAPTPSAAAELVVSSRLELEARLQRSGERIQFAANNMLENFRSRLENLISSAGFKEPQYLLEQFLSRVDEAGRHMEERFKNFMNSKEQIFQGLTGRLNALSPLAILERGYSVSFDEHGKIVKKTGQVSVGSSMRTRFRKGSVLSKITAIQEDEEI
ncbi:MAG TPA: exodeoxyribonuclease VII large subunit [Candidatus Omnitrophota bacterium]|nr:exodeoxyribonuclease VII large subunit [Candidatus Omnitrophota bacterium]HRY86179.1 exodeoxyribonuclease VII large subunit [Candidatus Omnitrophota bacterium]